MNLRLPSRTLPTRLLAALVALVATTLIFTPAASAEPVSVTYVRLGGGFNDIYNSEDAGPYVFNVGGKEVLAFCADVTKAFNGSANFSAVPSAASAIPGIEAAGWVVANAASVGTVAADVDVEVAAIQVAVWAFTNSITIDATTVPHVEFRDRALELVAAAGTNTVSSAPASFALAVTATAADGVAHFAATLTTDDGAPIENETIEFQTTDGNSLSGSVVTDASGTALWQAAPADSAAPTVAVEATWSGMLVAGTVLVADDGSQPLVLAEPVPVTRTASASADTTVAAPADPTPAPPADPAPAPAPAADPAATAAPVEELPYTGGSLGLPHLVAGLAALAAAAFVVTRMRRTAIV